MWGIEPGIYSILLSLSYIRFLRTGPIGSEAYTFNTNSLTLRRSLREKLRMRWFFDISKVKDSIFFKKSDLTDPPQIFDAHLLGNTDLSPSRFYFSVGFISRSCF